MKIKIIKQIILQLLIIITILLTSCNTEHLNLSRNHYKVKEVDDLALKGYDITRIKDLDFIPKTVTEGSMNYVFQKPLTSTDKIPGFTENHLNEMQTHTLFKDKIENNNNLFNLGYVLTLNERISNNKINKILHNILDFRKTFQSDFADKKSITIVKAKSVSYNINRPDIDLQFELDLLKEAKSEQISPAFFSVYGTHYIKAVSYGAIAVAKTNHKEDQHDPLSKAGKVKRAIVNGLKGAGLIDYEHSDYDTSVKVDYHGKIAMNMDREAKNSFQTEGKELVDLVIAPIYEIFNDANFKNKVLIRKSEKVSKKLYLSFLKYVDYRFEYESIMKEKIPLEIFSREEANMEINEKAYEKCKANKKDILKWIDQGKSLLDFKPSNDYMPIYALNLQDETEIKSCVDNCMDKLSMIFGYTKMLACIKLGTRDQVEPIRSIDMNKPNSECKNQDGHNKIANFNFGRGSPVTMCVNSDVDSLAELDSGKSNAIIHIFAYKLKPLQEPKRIDCMFEGKMKKCDPVLTPFLSDPAHGNDYLYTYRRSLERDSKPGDRLEKFLATKMKRTALHPLKR